MTNSPKADYLSALVKLSRMGLEPHSGFGDAWASGLGVVPVPALTQPSLSDIKEAEERFDQRLRQLDKIFPLTVGRVVPAEEDLAIGDAKRLHLAILFLDICKFSEIPNGEDAEQDRVLKLLNLFMAEMLHVVKSHRGEFEKNTGDGIMAYFKETTDTECAQQAVDAAVEMHCYNDEVISPRLKLQGLPEVKFRVGIEAGSVIIAKVGTRGDHRSLVAIGNTPNVACKLMTLIPNGGIALGNYTRHLLSPAWQNQTAPLNPLLPYVLKGTSNPYPAWALNYRARRPTDYSGMLGALLGGQ
jgi:class 3 adenylate cyclase